MNKMGFLSSRLTTFVVPLLAILAGLFYVRLRHPLLLPGHSAMRPPTWDRSWQSPVVFSKEELAKYNGRNGARSYLVVLGEVYDVTGSEHYQEGSGYYVFIGKDSSLAFVSGKFDENTASDDVSVLDTSQIKGIEDWVKFYRTHETYKFVGVLEGRYYNKKGRRTKAWQAARDKMELGAKLAKEREERSSSTPTCNSQWTQDEGTKVWCEDSMAKEAVDLPLVPRKVDEGSGFTRCLCVSWSTAQKEPEKYSVYEGCTDGPDRLCHIKPAQPS